MGILATSGRFALLEKPLAYPFKDVVTGTPEGAVFDLSVDVENYDGVVYVKVEHIEEMAHVLGMITKDEATDLYARIAELEAENKKLPDEVEELVNGIAGLVSRYRTGGTTGISVPPYLADPISDEESVGDSESESGIRAGDSEESDELERLLNGTDGQADSDSRDKRPAKLSASASNEFGFGISDD